MATKTELTRRTFLSGAVALGGVAALAGCVTSGSSGGSTKGSGTGAIVFQNSESDPDPKAALTALVKEYNANPVGGKITMNTVATEQFRAQLSTYLTSSNPPDVLSWYAGSVARDYASKGLLLDLSELWEGKGVASKFSTALKQLSSDDKGRQIFMPTDYYWWGVFYFKSNFKKWGVEVPTTWDEFISLCDKLKGQGINPLAQGLSTTPWMASGWFDILDLRVNGAQFHRELLAGKHSFDSPEVKKVMKYYAQLVPYFDPNMGSYAWQDAVTPLVQGKDAMYLAGAFISENVTQNADDLDFFSVPVIDKSIPSAEEAPTDGYFASAHSKNKQSVMDFLTYMASPKQQEEFIQKSKSSNLPTSPDVSTSNFSPLVQKGLKLLNETKEITQFFNRDSSDALQTTADTALVKFLATPKDVDQILADWQTAAKKVWNS